MRVNFNVMNTFLSYLIDRSQAKCIHLAMFCLPDKSVYFSLQMKFQILFLKLFSSIHEVLTYWILKNKLKSFDIFLLNSKLKSMIPRNEDPFKNPTYLRGQIHNKMANSSFDRLQYAFEFYLFDALHARFPLNSDSSCKR